jgi:hypothetical protein
MKIYEVVDKDNPYNTWYSFAVDLQALDKLYSFVMKTSNNFNLPSEIFDEDELLFLLTSLSKIEENVNTFIPPENEWYQKTKQLSTYLKG